MLDWFNIVQIINKNGLTFVNETFSSTKTTSLCYPLCVISAIKN